MTFRHLLLTRFNLRIPNWTHDKRGVRVQTPDWLEHRFDLFEGLCLPSIRAQSARNFEWWIFFDSATPAIYRDRIGNCRQVFPFEPIFCESFEAALKILRTRAPNEAGHLITTRLDNDDALHRDAIAHVQRAFRQQRLEFLHFPRGYNYEGSVYPARSPRGAFVSLVEAVTSEPCRTVWCENHSRLHQLGPVRQLGGARFWLRTVHERNLTTSIRPVWFRALRRVRRQLGPDRSLAPLRLADVAPDFGIDPGFLSPRPAGHVAGESGSPSFASTSRARSSTE